MSAEAERMQHLLQGRRWATNHRTLLTALAKALEDTAAERDRLKDALHEIRLGCINPQQVAHNSLFREENP